MIPEACLDHSTANQPGQSSQAKSCPVSWGATIAGLMLPFLLASEWSSVSVVVPRRSLLASLKSQFVRWKCTRRSRTLVKEWIRC